MKKTWNRKVDDGRKPGATQPESVAPSTNTVAPRQTKAALLRTLLGAPGGASLTRIMTETRWQAHTVRAALTGLRKAGLHLTRRREGDDTIYATRAAAAAAPTVADAIDGDRKEPDAAQSVPDAGGSGPDASEQGLEAIEARA